MPEYSAQVFVCVNSEGADDNRHCGDKGGREIRQKFNELLVERGLLNKVTINNVGCTSQHKFCDTAQASIIVYGPDHALGGTWYAISPDDVDEIISEHLINGRIVERVQNKERSVKLV